MLHRRDHQALQHQDLPGERGVLREALEVPLSPLPTLPAGQGVDYVEQRSEEMTYYLFETLAPRGRVSVLAERTLRFAGGRIALAIIGSSHFLEVEIGGSVLCEMLACPRPGLGEEARLAERVGTGQWTHHLRGGHLSYRFEMWRGWYAASEFERETRRLSEPAENRLRFTFPGREAPGSAITCLEWQPGEEGAAITTHHTFPEERIMVHTRSVIDVVEAGASQ